MKYYIYDIMSTNLKNVQIKLEPDVYRDAKVELAKRGKTWQDIIEEFIKTKFLKRGKDGRSENK